MDSETPRLGFIGLGLMGREMADRLLDDGYELTVWNREPEPLAAFAARGARIASSPADLALYCEIVLVCVTDTAAVNDVIFGESGVCSASGRPRIVVDHSTAMPLPTAEMAARLRESWGIELIDAPVSGGPAFARERRLTVMAGGSSTAFAAARPIFDSYAANVTRVGPPGAGQSAKVINQAISGVSYVLMAEVLRLAETCALDPALIPAALAGGHADSTMLRFAYPRMLNRDFEPPASLAGNVLKDLHNVQAEAERLGFSLPLIDRAAERFEAFTTAEGPHVDTSAIVRLYGD